MMSSTDSYPREDGGVSIIHSLPFLLKQKRQGSRKRANDDTQRISHGVVARKLESEAMRIKETAQRALQQLSSSSCAPQVSQQSVTSSKTMFISSHHKLGSLHPQLERDSSGSYRQFATSSGQSEVLPSFVSDASTAKLTLSDIRIPLAWNVKDHFKNRGDARRFALFCLFKCQDEVIDTNLVYDVGREATDIPFKEMLTFNDIPHDFSISVELYSCLMDAEQQPPSSAGTDNGLEAMRALSSSGSLRLRQKLKSSLRRSLGSKLGQLVRKHLDSAEALNETSTVNPEKAVNFVKIASTSLNADDICGLVAKSFDFQYLDTKSEACPPLYGHICCSLSAQVASTLNPLFTGKLLIRFPSASQDQSYYCELQLLALSCWLSHASAKHGAKPHLVIPFDKFGPNRTGLIVSVSTGKSKLEQFKISARSESDLESFRRAADRSILDHRKDFRFLLQTKQLNSVWGPLAAELVEAPSAADLKSQFSYASRPGGKSLYDTIAISSGDASSAQFSHQKASVEQPMHENGALDCSYSAAVGLDRNSIGRSAIRPKKTRTSLRALPLEILQQQAGTETHF